MREKQGKEKKSHRLIATVENVQMVSGRPNAPTERCFVTLLGWTVCGPRVGTGVIIAGVSLHAEFNFNIHLV